MLTIGRLAAYSGVTTRAVRHYHQIGLLPEPERDASGYRTYAAPAVVRLIRIRTLAEAGVPLARVEELLAAGDSLALPASVTTYLDRMRTLGAPEVMVEMERDAWILIAAQMPEQMDEFMVQKDAQLDDPLMRRFLAAIGAVIAGDDESEDVLAEIADLVVEMAEQAAARGELDGQDDALPDSSFADLLDTVVLTAGPRLVRLRDRIQELMLERGWSGLVKMERVGQPDRASDGGMNSP
ncbi:MerR family transcriptional regulator [Nocardioides szechwanensis]|uniref:MerR family regulatory protein n=1 Tax=Nocardioides szechwanensis TaxID=1005944 RepID=A0A1H0DUD6_9ACTN|nr:MerR family transcriptional regulator [Nocardioides szechwanensis]GEP35247.1 MerR family transcriptional regulator [Nocardioides szechwanensis]SDN73794.1 MerR family regulatory protein [Nocardioides szechwanensis]